MDLEKLERAILVAVQESEKLQFGYVYQAGMGILLAAIREEFPEVTNVWIYNVGNKLKLRAGRN